MALAGRVRHAGIHIVSGIVILVMPLLFSCSHPREQPNVSQQLDTYFQNQFPPDEPGGAILIMKNKDTILCKGYGLADLATKEKITPTTLFNLGSISKTFVANAILLLQEEGKLSVEDSLWKYFPKFKNEALAQKISIKHLLTHTSGLPDTRQIKRDSIFYLSAKDEENWYPVSQADAPEFEPGSRFKYSNPAFNALALIVEQTSGMKWQKFVEDRIMKPSGMMTSTITDGPYPEHGVSHGYIRVNGKWTERDYGEEPTFAAAGNGGVWSSVLELEKYEEALETNKWLPAKTVANSRMVKRFKNWSDENEPAVAWSWFIGATSDSLKTIGHVGDQGGFQANYVVIPAKGIHFFMLCNTPRNRDAMTREVFKRLGVAGVSGKSVD